MPTGYTYKVEDGTITSFEEYALECARNFGACVTLRGEPLSSDIPEFKVDYYHTKAHKTSLDRFSFLIYSHENILRDEYQKHLSNLKDINEKGLEKAKQQRDNYEKMLEKALKFKPPTPNHQNYADFIVSQLRESMDFDSVEYYLGEIEKIGRLSFEDWLKTEKEIAKSSIDYHYKEQQEEIERVERRNKWISDLRKAIKEVE